MSMAPNNPFQDPQNDQGYGESPPPKKSGKGCILGIVIASALGMLVCCGGGVFLAYFGLGVLASEFERRLAGNPDIVEHVGDIESFEFSFTGTIEEGQNAEQQGGETPLAFDVKGSKGSARILILQDKGGDGSGIESATLVMPDGTRHAIDVGDENGNELDDFNLEEMIDPGDLDPGEPVVEPEEVSPTVK